MLLLPAATLLGVAFATPSAASAVALENMTTMNYVFRFGSVPMMLFPARCPVGRCPAGCARCAYATPLWLGVALCRGLSLATRTSSAAAIHVAYPDRDGGHRAVARRTLLPQAPLCLSHACRSHGRLPRSPTPVSVAAVHAMFPGTRGLRLIERHARFYRRLWLVVASGAAEPAFYLLSVGVGIGALVGDVAGPGGQPVPYRAFVAPGLLAVSALNGTLNDSTFDIYGRLEFEKLYDAVLATPLGAQDVALAEIGWAVLRGLMYSVSFLIVMAAMGLIASPWAVLALPAAALVSFATAAIGVWLTTYMKSWQNFEYVVLVAVPMFLFSGTFYPLSVYPHVIGVIVAWSPLYQGVVILRDLVLGAPSADLVWRAGYLIALGALGLALAGRRIGKLLLV